MNKREQRNLQKRKLKASEEKCSRSPVLLKSSAPGVMTSSEAASSEATFHQKLKFIWT